MGTLAIRLPDEMHERLNRLAQETARPKAYYVKAALDTCKEKVKLFSGLKDFCDFYFQEEILEYDRESARKDFVPENRPRLGRLRDAFAQLPNFEPAALETTLKAVAAELGVKVGLLVHPTRLACTGKPIGPSLYHLLAVLGKERVLQRLDKVLGHLGHAR